MEQYEGKSGIGWLIATYIFALLGGYFGIVLGIFMYMAKEKVLNEETGKYEKLPKFKSSHRKLGLLGAFLAIISVFIWKFALS